MSLYLTKSNWVPILRWIPDLLGMLMDWIFNLLNLIGIPNVGVTIILLTVILYMIMTPLQVKQQRFSKLNVIMQPELTKIQKKYAGKRDAESQQRQMDEMNAVYAKYGVSQMGSCVQTLIILPIMMGLYQVIYRIPGYITLIGQQLRTVAEDSSFVSFFKEFISGLNNAALTSNLGAGTTENVMDTVYRLNSSQWSQLLEAGQGKSFESSLTSLQGYIGKVTTFLGLNISDAPMDIIVNGLKNGAILLVIVAVLFPIVAWLTQYLTIRMTPMPNAEGSMGSTMKTMNFFMPLLSAAFTIWLPTGIGIYLIVGSLVRLAQQFFINKWLEKESIDDILEKAAKKAEKKREKAGYVPKQITDSAHIKTRALGNISDEAEKKAKEIEEDASDKEYNPNSIAAKANMVRSFDKRNSERGKKNKGNKEE